MAVEIRDSGKDGGANGLTVSNITCGDGDILIAWYAAKDASDSPAVPYRNGNAMSTLAATGGGGEYVRAFIDLQPDVGTYNVTIGGLMNQNRLFVVSISGAQGYEYTWDADMDNGETDSFTTSPLGLTLASSHKFDDGTGGGISADTNLLSGASSLGTTIMGYSNGTGTTVTHTAGDDNLKVIVYNFSPASGGGITTWF